MNASPCREPLSLELLAAYQIGELDPPRAEAVEAHYFACAGCAARLAALQALGTAVARLMAAGRLAVATTVDLLQRAAAAGLKLGVYRLAPGEAVHCTIRRGDDANVLRLQAAVAGVARVDVEMRGALGPSDHLRLEDVAVDRDHGEVVLVYPGEYLRTLGHATVDVELLGHGEGAVQRLARYTLHHSPPG